LRELAVGKAGGSTTALLQLEERSREPGAQGTMVVSAWLLVDQGDNGEKELAPCMLGIEGAATARGIPGGEGGGHGWLRVEEEVLCAKEEFGRGERNGDEREVASTVLNHWIRGFCRDWRRGTRPIRSQQPPQERGSTMDGSEDHGVQHWVVTVEAGKR
jgi:hypothetical protein